MRLSLRLVQKVRTTLVQLKVNLVSDHPRCTATWSLTGGGRLREKSTKEAQTELINVITERLVCASQTAPNENIAEHVTSHIGFHS